MFVTKTYNVSQTNTIITKIVSQKQKVYICSKTKCTNMTEKRVRINENVHQKLSNLKEETGAKSLSDVIYSLILIAEEFYTNDGKLNVKNKKILLKYDNGRLVEIEIK